MTRRFFRIATFLAALLPTACLSSTSPLLNSEAVFADLAQEIHIDEYELDKFSFTKKTSSLLKPITNSSKYSYIENNGKSVSEISFERLKSGWFNTPIKNYYIVMQKDVNVKGEPMYHYGISFFNGNDIYLWGLDSNEFRDLSNHRKVDLGDFCNDATVPTAGSSNSSWTGVWLKVDDRSTLFKYMNNCVNLIKRNKIAPRDKFTISKISYD